MSFSFWISLISTLLVTLNVLAADPASLQPSDEAHTKIVDLRKRIQEVQGRGTVEFKIPRSGESRSQFEIIRAVRNSSSKVLKISNEQTPGITGVGNGGDYLIGPDYPAGRFLDLVVYEAEKKAGLVHIQVRKFPTTLLGLFEELFKIHQILATYNPRLADRWLAFIEAYAGLLSGENSFVEEYRLLLMEEDFSMDIVPLGLEGFMSLNHGRNKLRTKVLRSSLDEGTTILFDVNQMNQDLKTLENVSWLLVHEFLWTLGDQASDFDYSISRGINIALHATEIDSELDSFLSLALTQQGALTFSSDYYFHNLLSLKRLNGDHLSELLSAMEENRANGDVKSFMFIRASTESLFKYFFRTQDQRVLDLFSVLLDDKNTRFDNFARFFTHFVGYEFDVEVLAEICKNEKFLHSILGFESKLQTLFNQEQLSSQFPLEIMTATRNIRKFLIQIRKHQETVHQGIK